MKSFYFGPKVFHRVKSQALDTLRYAIIVNGNCFSKWICIGQNAQQNKTNNLIILSNSFFYTFKNLGLYVKC